MNNHSNDEFNYLVKFTKLDYIDTVINNKLKAGFPHEFNDPFDPRLHLDKKKAIELAISLKIPFEVVEFYVEHLSSVQITSFIRQNPVSYKSNLMWAHYANSGKGMAVLYDYEEVKRQYSGTLGKVEYGQSYMDPQMVIDNYIRYYFLNDLRYQNDSGTNLQKFFKYKHSDWEYENEYRIITFGYISSIISIFRKYTGKINIYEQKNYFKMRMLTVQSLYEISKLFTRTTDEFNSIPDASGYVGLIGVNRLQTIDIPHYDTLFIGTPKPKKIILGWNVEKEVEIKIKNICNDYNIKLRIVHL